MKCIEFPLGGYDFYGEYSEYIKSHKWKTIYTKGRFSEKSRPLKCVPFIEIPDSQHQGQQPIFLLSFCR